MTDVEQDVQPATDPKSISTAPFASDIKTISLWIPQNPLHRETLALVSIGASGELAELFPDPSDCYLHDGLPHVVLGETRIVHRSQGLRWFDSYEALPRYSRKTILEMTRTLVCLQLEKEHAAAGPGQRYKALEKDIAELKGKIK